MKDKLSFFLKIQYQIYAPIQLYVLICVEKELTINELNKNLASFYRGGYYLLRSKYGLVGVYSSSENIKTTCAALKYTLLLK